MDDDAAVASSPWATSTTALPEPVAAGGAARRLRDACEPLAMHAVWARRTNEALAGLGLDFLTGYVWGRGAALGEPEAAVVVSAFAVFEPGLLAGAYERGRRRCPRARLLSSRTEATVASLEAVLADVDGAEVGEVLTVLRRGLAAADGTGRPLFSGLSAQPWPESPVGSLWRACDLLREHRGDGHVAACVVAGLDPVGMNVLTELFVGMPLGSYTATRGWSEADVAAAVAALEARGVVADGGLTDEGRRQRAALEERTDALQQPVVDAIGGDLDTVVRRLNEWSQACIDAGAFPPDVGKRAAG